MKAKNARKHKKMTVQKINNDARLPKSTTVFQIHRKLKFEIKLKFKRT